MLLLGVAAPSLVIIRGFVISTAFLIYIAILALSSIVSYFEREKPIVRFAWLPNPPVAANRKDLVISIITLSIAGLVLLWTVVAQHLWIYPYLKEQGIM